MTSARAIAVSLVLLLSLPLAHASWRAQGQQEPDTPHDEAWAWPDAPREAGAHRVYFNAYPTLPPAGNPNVAALGGRLHPTPVLRWEAVLGIWLDCNRDGYLGLAETGALEYPSAALLDRSLCPQASGPLSHHSGGIVRELLHLAEVDPCRFDAASACAPFQPAPGVILANGTRVWGDVGAPGAAGHETCPLHPLPRGATSNTGLLLRHLDCPTQHRVIGAVNTVDDEGHLGLAIEDPDRPEESRSLLVRDLPVSAFGNPRTGRAGLLEEGTGRPTARAWDCARGQPAAPTLARDIADASAWDAAAHLADGAAGDCDPATGSPVSPHAPGPFVEAPVEPTLHTGRDRNDLVLRWLDERPLAQTPARAPVTLEPWRAAPPRAPAAPGVPWRGWVADATIVSAPQVLDRGSLQPAGPREWTFYAHLGAEASAWGIRVPHAAGAGVYGAEACRGQTGGVRAGWVCDATRWWQDQGRSTRPTHADGTLLGAVPGSPYHLRDTDCLDGTIAGPLRLSLVDVSDEGPCAGAPAL